MTSDLRRNGSREHLFGRFEAVASRAPDNVAIVAGDAQVTYGELARRVAWFCAELADAGVQPRDRVVVVLPNGVEFIVATLAIWKRGAILTPLHAQLREGEFARYVADCRARAIITTEAMGGAVDALIEATGGSVAYAWLWPKDGANWIHRQRPGEQRAAGAAGDPALDAQWPALTQYSTGSTGHPKRITRSHGQVLGELEAVSEVLARTEADRVLGVAPFFHSHGLMNAALGALLGWITPLRGGKVLPARRCPTGRAGGDHWFRGRALHVPAACRNARECLVFQPEVCGVGRCASAGGDRGGVQGQVRSCHS